MYTRRLMFQGLFIGIIILISGCYTSQKTKMNTQIKTELDIQYKNGIWATLKITNQGGQPVKVYHPGKHSPVVGWKHSNEAYQVALFQSFHILKMTLVDQNGTQIKQNNLVTMADPAFLHLDLVAGNEISMDIPLHEFYNLTSGLSYSLLVIYGRGNIITQAKTRFVAN